MALPRVLGGDSLWRPRQDVGGYFDPLVLAKIANMSLRARHVVEGLLSGLHRAHTGATAWNLPNIGSMSRATKSAALTGKPTASSTAISSKSMKKKPISGPISSSMPVLHGLWFGTGLSKFDYGCYLAASLAYLMLRQGDDVGLVTFGAQVQRYIPPRGGPASTCRPWPAIWKPRNRREKRIWTRCCANWLGKCSRRGMIIVISDLFDDPRGGHAGLAILSAST